MPPKSRFTKEEIVDAALDITREEGFRAVTARALGTKLDSSPKVIFGLFTNMEELQREVIKSANDLYQRYLQEDMAAGKYPPYKASGMAYIRFAKEETELFKLLFMRTRTKKEAEQPSDEMDEILALIQKNTGLTAEQALYFHLEMWVFVHGIATMLATSYLELDTETISAMLTDMYMGLKNRFQESEENTWTPSKPST